MIPKVFPKLFKSETLHWETISCKHNFSKSSQELIFKQTAQKDILISIQGLLKAFISTVRFWFNWDQVQMTNKLSVLLFFLFCRQRKSPALTQRNISPIWPKLPDLYPFLNFCDQFKEVNSIHINQADSRARVFLLILAFCGGFCLFKILGCFCYWGFLNNFFFFSQTT